MGAHAVKPETHAAHILINRMILQYTNIKPQPKVNGAIAQEGYEACFADFCFIIDESDGETF